MLSRSVAFWRSDARHLLPPKTPWLYFHRDHPLRYDYWLCFKPEYETAFWEDKEAMQLRLGDAFWDDDDDA
jgi:hypothetical protein